MKHNHLTPEEVAERDARILELTFAGYNAPTIAQKVGVSDRTVHRVRRRHGIPAAVPNCMTENEILQAAALLDDGASYGEASRTIGRPISTIQKHLPGRSVWKPGSGIEIHRYLAQLESICPIARGVAS